jgi:hypothetical protein
MSGLCVVPGSNIEVSRFSVVAGALAGPRCARLDPKALHGPGPARAPATTLNRARMPARQFDFARLAGGTIPFIRKYSTICP